MYEQENCDILYNVGKSRKTSVTRRSHDRLDTTAEDNH